MENSEQQVVTIKPESGFGQLQTLLDSKKLPVHIKTVEEAFTIVQMGKELKFPPMQAFHYIIPIQGRLSLSAKAIGAVLRNRGVQFKTIEDAVYIYKNGTSSPDNAEDKPVDRRTKILFRRDGWDETVDYLWTDAVKAGYTTKDNWTRMPREMLYSRCLSKGANRVGQDLLLGLYSTDELYDTVSNLTEQDVVRDPEDGSILEVLK